MNVSLPRVAFCSCCFVLLEVLNRQDEIVLRAQE